jgi:CBS-domain-containing membrane protein
LLSTATPLLPLSASGTLVNLEHLVRRPGLTIEPGLSIERVFQLFNGMACRFLPVVDTEGSLQGVITRAQMVRCQWNLERGALPAAASGAQLLRRAA